MSGSFVPWKNKVWIYPQRPTIGKKDKTLNVTPFHRRRQVAPIKMPSVLLNSVPPSSQDKPRETHRGPPGGSTREWITVNYSLFENRSISADAITAAANVVCVDSKVPNCPLNILLIGSEQLVSQTWVNSCIICFFKIKPQLKKQRQRLVRMNKRNDKKTKTKNR